MLHFNIAVEQKSGVVFVIVSHGVDVLHRLCGHSWSFDQSLEISNQVWQLLHLNVPLDYITWVEIANGIEILVKGLVVVFFLIVLLVSMLLANLGVYLSGELGAESDALGL